MTKDMKKDGGEYYVAGLYAGDVELAIYRVLEEETEGRPLAGDGDALFLRGFRAACNAVRAEIRTLPAFRAPRDDGKEKEA